MRLRRVLLTGGSGLIGHALLPILLQRDWVGQILLPLRQPQSWCAAHPQLAADNRIQVLTYDELFASQQPVDLMLCALGTTQAKAGKAGLRAVDYQLVVDCAVWAEQQGAELVSVVSALGANRRSLFFYNRVKGDMEQALERLDIASLHLWQPSVLIGARGEFRLAEHLSGWLLRLPVWGDAQALRGERIARAMVVAAESSLADTQKSSVTRYRVRDIKRLAAA
ncbi:MAG: hypothetical protein LRY72_18325 [Saccharospirillaceae bacterium]|nr:hypothetical protein [Saccharospirillaceae bacterium]